MSSTAEKIKQLQLAEQGMQQLLSQKQAFQVQLMETDSALKELEGTQSAYRIVGNIMVSAKTEKLVEDLSSKKETLQLRIRSVEKQEASMRERAEQVQKEVLEAMKNDDKNGK